MNLLVKFEILAIGLVTSTSRPYVTKLFTAVFDKLTQQAGVFDPDKPLQSSLMFADKAGAYLSGAPFGCFILV